MSWCDRRTAILGVLALAGCGFRPLYGKSDGQTGSGGLLGSVAISSEDGELGFRLRDALVRTLTPASADAPLLLKVTTNVSRSGLVIQKDDEITRFNLNITSSYALTRRSDDKDQKPLTSGDVKSIAAFNATSSQYATLVSEREVLDRASRDVAEKIVNRIAASFEPRWLR